MGNIEFEKEYSGMMKQLAGMIRARKILEEKEKPLRKALLDAMKNHSMEKYGNGLLHINVVKEKCESTCLDIDAFRTKETEQYLKLVERFPKTIRPVKEHIRATLMLEGILADPSQQGKVYVDARGWRYKVMGTTKKKNAFKPHYLKPKGMVRKWVCMSSQPWRSTFEEAQADIDVIAIKNGWQSVDDDD